jgi:N6-L-threonylcarbamoyladenine synthase
MSDKKFPQARILGIETSCDETAAAVVENGRTILSNVVASQAKLHAKYGGVFPEVASREHIKAIYPVVQQALQQAHLQLNDIDAIAVTRGPGLPGSLVVGINIAKGLALASGKPLLGVNHLEEHIYSAWLDTSDADDEGSPEPEFPSMALIVSGGHSELVLVRDHLDYERLGGTLDDAAGEAFDKVARLLGLSYPGGPAIQKVALNGDPEAFALPRAWLEGTWNFSFSGLKTAVLHVVRDIQEKEKKKVFDEEGVEAMASFNIDSVPLPVEDLAASFQAAVVEVLVTKTRYAAQEYGVKEIIVVGGVSANKALRQGMSRNTPGRVHIPPIFLCTDNAAMTAALGYYRYVLGQRDGLDMDALPTWPISEL